MSYLLCWFDNIFIPFILFRQKVFKLKTCITLMAALLSRYALTRWKPDTVKCRRGWTPGWTWPSVSFVWHGGSHSEDTTQEANFHRSSWLFFFPPSVTSIVVVNSCSTLACLKSRHLFGMALFSLAAVYTSWLTTTPLAGSASSESHATFYLPYILNVLSGCSTSKVEC